MSTFILPNSNNVTVSLVDDLSQEQLLGFPAFKNWLSTVQRNLSLQAVKHHEFNKSPYELRKINIQSIDRFGGSKLGFVKLQAEIKNTNGETLPGSVFLRGPSVGMMVLLQPDDLPRDSQAEKHVLLTVQPRIPAGGLQFVELPAGMVDDGTFAGSAAKEIKEELGLEIPEDELTNLTEMAIPKHSGRDDEEELPKAIFPSAGGCDEYIPIFLHEKRVPRVQLQEWTGKLTGLRDEGEKITLKLVKLEDLWWEGARDAKALGAWALWSGLRNSGKL
ncbi:NUDIX domain-containing protein [Phlyctema vagabunda]|uniref:NUDIX domain-containing protein n=1 Tax=Phlyctema vagabunda TaxID=108571 RepID=A0ABR4PLN7_9HELO